MINSTVNRNSFFLGGAMMGFAITIMGFIFPFPNQISFVLSIILSSFVLIVGLILITLIEKKEEGKYGKSRR